MVRFTIEPATGHVPDGLDALASAATAEGIRIVSTVVARWRDGTERFDGPGERLLVAVDDAGRVVGIGGISACPTVAGALRVRRFYVDPGWRRAGVGRALAEAVIEHALAHVDLLTCNARASAAAPVFWERMGFEPVDRDGITHVRRA